MKQITIATLAALMLGTAQADYTLKFPLEQAQGGQLPNGSINFIAQPANQPDQPDQAICDYRPYNVAEGVTYANNNIRLWRTYFYKDSLELSQLDAYFDDKNVGYGGFFPYGEVIERDGFKFYPDKSQLHEIYDFGTTISYTYSICIEPFTN